MKNKMVLLSINRPRLIIGLTILITFGLALFFPLVHVDTDPENMLSKKEAVRIFHNEMKKQFALRDMVVVGIVNEKHPEGVFNKESLNRVYELTQFALNFRWEEKKTGEEQKKDGEETLPNYAGVISIDVMAPSTLDHIEPGKPGFVNFDILMREPPKTEEEAKIVKQRILSNPMLKGTLVSEDGKALCIYLPLSSKDLSYRLYSKLKEKINTFKGDEKYYITGLPVAEDTFGVEMFIQMAISAPTAMLLIFILLLVFFKKLLLIISPMIVALVSVICTMGLLIGTGNTVHIMSSMIPIFIMPIAVLDSIHILSEFFDRYQETRDRKQTIIKVMEELFTPMLYTSLTSAAGFASLALTPIPPVQVFGLFVGFGIMLAWVLTMTFIPAYIIRLSESSLENFGAVESDTESSNLLSEILQKIGNFSCKRGKTIIAGALILMVVAGYGISLININDNPVKWFVKKHPIREADRVLNQHFGGTYMAYLALSPKENLGDIKTLTKIIKEKINKKAKDPNIKKEALAIVDKASESKDLKQFSRQIIDNLWQKADDHMEIEEWETIAGIAELQIIESKEIFKSPELLRYVIKLQQHLAKSGVVGKSNALPDVVRKINKELHEGEEKYYRIPDKFTSVSECLDQYQSSHDPDDLWHLTTTNYGEINIWLQLRSGDNQDMEKVAQSAKQFFEKNPGPIALEHNWFGLTYINVIWQNKMVNGMLEVFLGSFIVVFLMMTVLFRSPLWGLLSMIPLTITISFIYGIVGLVGKDYDMPVAVLSSLTLGLAVDFAIHFLARTRAAVEENGGWQEAIPVIFGEPARAIFRNVIVIAVGFTPLLLAPLVPYQTVGVLLATILFFSGIATLFLLPALITVFQKILFREKKEQDL